MGNVILALIFVGLLIAILVAMVRGIKVQREGSVGVVEAWGRFARVVPPGRYILLPWEQIAHEVPLQIFEYETPAQQVATRGAPVTITLVIHYQVEHAQKTPGAPRPGVVMGSAPAPIGTPQLTPAYASSPNAATIVQSRLPSGIDSLEPANRHRGAGARSTRGGLSAAGLARRTSRGLSSAGAAVFGRMFGRSVQLDIEQAAYRALYAVPDWRKATEHESINTLQVVFSTVNAAEDIIGNVNWQYDLGERVRSRLSAKTQLWGVEILGVSFKDLKLSEMTLNNLNAEARVEREGRMRSKEAENYRRIAEILGLSPSELLRWRQVEVLRELAKNPQARIMFTTDMAGRGGAMPPMMEESSQAPPRPAGYLGGEPPVPSLPQPQPTVDALQPVPPTAPTLQRTDQQ